MPSVVDQKRTKTSVTGCVLSAWTLEGVKNFRKFCKGLFKKRTLCPPLSARFGTMRTDSMCGEFEQKKHAH